MKITISQQGEKLIAEFHHGKIVDKYTIDKAEEFLVCVDKLLKKRHTVKIDWKNVKLEFHNAGLLTERVIRSIILGLSFSQN